MIYLREISIDELSKFKFLIPSYQREYCWGKTEIEQLLTDIDNFVNRKIEFTSTQTYYCLQQIVVKECNEEIKQRNNLVGTWYELLDGQQRLITILLIIQYINQTDNNNFDTFQIK